MAEIIAFPNTGSVSPILMSLQQQLIRQTFDFWQSFLPVRQRDVDIRTGDVTIYYPFGNGLTLFANPATSWFDTQATDDMQTERRIVTEVASYGKQLGWVLEALLPLAEDSDEVAPETLARLNALKNEIEAVKDA